MAQTVDAYFDFRSPYAYFAACRIARGDVTLPAGVAWRWQPVSINVLLNLQAGRAPSAPYVDALAPTKRRYVAEDVLHCSVHHRLPLSMPKPLRPDTVPALAAFASLEPLEEATERFFTSVFDAVWRRQQDVGDPETLADIARTTGVDPASVARAYTQDARDELIERSVNLYEGVGVFGVPTFVWNKERYYGADRLDVLHAAVAKATAPPD